MSLSILGGSLALAARLLLPAAGPCAGTVALDAGHTDKATGATSARGVAERTFNVKLALEVEQALSGYGIQVVRVPAGSLADRAEAASRAALFVSIHHDSVQERFLEKWTRNGGVGHRTRHAAGYSVFVSGDNGRYEDSKAVALEVGKRLRALGRPPALHHAEPIPGENRPLLDTDTGVYRFDGLRVLKTNTPSLLVEAAVITNDLDEKLADSDAFRATFARALAGAVRDTCPAWGAAVPPTASGGP
jgi:N-acetylmuramoyl-L-alanine amidase